MPRKTDKSLDHARHEAIMLMQAVDQVVRFVGEPSKSILQARSAALRKALMSDEQELQ